MRSRVTLGLAMLAGLGMLAASSAQAQQQPPQPPMTAPRSAPLPAVPREWQVEGTVSKVDPLAKTVGVSTGFFGLLGKTVHVGEDTQIRVQGQPAAMMEIKEGARVKASYEVRDGKNVAKSIDVTAAQEEARPAAPPQTAPRKAPATPPTQ